ncbi:MAG TPA: porphobilinogen synthase [Phycisphaerae bacterium]|nr:porphobilinogen synthase [Phycisphaerae bacterium]HOJ73899.1 porphobilinogen synthase [Phycisphaerae bacterium]HOM50840.1 porphobilinogen synthase [Phycisphaerae bacterium]HOQ86770.1 porphobilinogen synthase [Phycisphaerae bacterium]HPP25985.1 porphobilinogen synthase [Phycisphaerae bacterium]
MPFPKTRLRRLRSSPAMRRMVRETRLSVDQLIYPLFVRPGRNVRQPIKSMPGQFQLSVDTLVEECKSAAELGLPAVLLFGIPERKDAVGSEAYADNGIVQQAVRAIKEALPDLLVITDVCLCEYTDHGHCGVIVDRQGRKDVDNDATLDLLVREAVSHAKAGADIIAPSDMMDGRVAAIRAGLDENGFANTPIMAYSAKYASSYYGPFRDAAESPPQFGDRKTYQMDIGNGDEALREVAADIEEGADIVMVKPALNYLDLIWRIKQAFGMPTAAYHVSGEFSMIKAAAANGWIDEKGAALEATTAIVRAGADMVITYYAKDLASWLAK